MLDDEAIILGGELTLKGTKRNVKSYAAAPPQPLPLSPLQELLTSNLGIPLSSSRGRRPNDGLRKENKAAEAGKRTDTKKKQKLTTVI